LLLVAGVLAVTAVAAVLVATLAGPGQKHATAVFSQVVGLYPGDQVRVMGVPVGTVEKITPSPDGGRVELSYSADAPVPADAQALIVAPTLVTARFVQLTPARVAGPRLPDGAVIGLDRTAVPVEFDEIKRQLDELTTALGPTGADADGSLGRALSTAARNLDGNGATLNQTVDQLAKAVGALADGRGDLFNTVRNLETVIAALRGADGQVRGFTTQLDQLSGTLADSSGDLGRALDLVDSSVQRIGEFVREHRDQLSVDVHGLDRVAQNLDGNRQALADLLQIAPTAVSNFQNIYDPFSGSLTGSVAGTQFQDLNSLTCSLLFTRGSGYDGCKAGLSPVLGAAHLDYPPAALDALRRNGSRNSIEENQTTRPDPHPTVRPPYDPARTPPKPHQGAGTRPYPAAGSSDQALSRLFVPAGGDR
jgi:phospholipid/cholesterol/gamma-HCH transport system substrate-binding protein